MKKILNKKKYQKIILISLVVIIFFIAIILIIVFIIQNKGVLTTNTVNRYLSKNTRWYIKDASELNNGFDLKIESKSIIYNKNSWEAIIDGIAYANSDGYTPKHRNATLTFVLQNKINNHDIELQLNKFGYFLKNPFSTSGNITISGKSSKEYNNKTSVNNDFFNIDLLQIRVKGINFPLAYLKINISQNSTFTFHETSFNYVDRPNLNSKPFNTLPVNVCVSNINDPGNHNADFKVPLALVGNNLRLNVANFFNQKKLSWNLKKIVIKNEDLIINWSLKK